MSHDIEDEAVLLDIDFVVSKIRAAANHDDLAALKNNLQVGTISWLASSVCARLFSRLS